MEQTIIAYVVTTDREFSATNSLDETRVLHRGDPIYSGETLSSKGKGEIVVSMADEGQQQFTLSNKDSLLFDLSLLEKGFEYEETAAEKEFVELALSGELTADDIDKLDATAAGGEESPSSSFSSDQFAQRDAQEVDVQSQLIPTVTNGDSFVLDANNQSSVPLANPDINSIREDAISVSGNVIDNPIDNNQDDFVGLAAAANDSPVTGVRAGDNTNNNAVGQVGSSVIGNFGSVTINTDGSYIYTLDNSLSSVQALDTGDALLEVFTYTITDGLGNTSTTTLTLVINGQNEVVVVTPEPTPEPEPVPVLELNDEVESVKEGGFTITDLSENLNLLNNDLADGATISSFSYNDENGDKQTVDAGAWVNSQYGSVKINSNGSWTFKSDATEFHGNIIDVINYTVTDSNGNNETASFNILVTDDIPFAKADFQNILEGTISISGNVYDNDSIGADAWSTPISGIKAGLDFSSNALDNLSENVEGQYGSIVLNSDGSFVYSLDNSNPAVQAISTGDELTEFFTYSIVDTDKDFASTYISIVINGDTELTLSGETATVVEGNFIISSSTENLNLLDNDGFTSYGGDIFSFSYTDESGATKTAKAGQSVDTQYGTAKINSDGSWTFTSDATEKHGVIVDVINYTVTDSNGNSETASFSITVTDTGLSASPDTNDAKEESKTSNSGNVFDNDNIVADVTATPVTGIAAGNDTSTSVNGNVATAVVGTYGSVTINADGSYDYTLDNSSSAVQKLNDSDNVVDEFVYTITDSDGDTATTTLRIDINGTDEPPPPPPPPPTNYTPTAVDDNNNMEQIKSEGAPDGYYSYTAYGNVFHGTIKVWNYFTNSFDDEVNPSGGADDIGGDGPIAVDQEITAFKVSGDPVFVSPGTTITDGNGGELTINADGDYKYVYSDKSPADVSFTYEITDSNGDTSFAELSLMGSPSGQRPIMFDEASIGIPEVIDNELDLINESDAFNSLSLADVLQLSDDSNNLTILGDSSESMSFKSEADSQWSKSDSSITENNIVFDVYTNSADSSVEVKVQQDINDHII